MKHHSQAQHQKLSGCYIVEALLLYFGPTCSVYTAHTHCALQIGEIPFANGFQTEGCYICALNSTGFTVYDINNASGSTYPQLTWPDHTVAAVQNTSY
jgi:hypothetical protein